MRRTLLLFSAIPLGAILALSVGTAGAVNTTSSGAPTRVIEIGTAVVENEVEYDRRPRPRR
jgi:hypothetical protein